MSNLERPYKILIGTVGVAADTADVANLTVGEIAVVGPDGAILAGGLATAEYIQIVQGTVDGPKFSDRIYGANVKSYKGSAYDAAEEQVSMIGYNGNAGDIESGSVAIGEEFSFHVVIKGFDKDLYSTRQLRKSFQYVAEAATQASVADGLKARLVGDAAFQDGATAKAGALIRVDVLSTGADRGIKLTALAQVAGKLDEGEQVSFEIGLDKGFTAATQIDELGYIYLDGAAPTDTDKQSAVPVKGTGTYQAVKDMEEFAQGFQGISNKRGFPVKDYPSYAVEGQAYNIIVIEHDHVHASGNLEQSIAAPAMTIVAFPDESGSGTQNDDVIGLLDTYMGSVPGAFAAIGAI
tara:strand:- start:828 stop:1880 length:1053 start_codon:yes stop_codon:yes gene_type:complete